MKKTSTHTRAPRSAALVLTTVLAVTSFAGASTARLEAAGSVEQVYVTGLAPGAQASLITPKGKTLYTQDADALGGLLFRNVPPGTGYVVRDGSGTTSAPLVVHDAGASPWDPSVYHQTIAPNGYQYLTTRDGTKLAIFVHPPANGAAEPYPTVIEYAGYGYADPRGPVSGIAPIANLMGFAVVDVNMRGTGCSGGAFDYFEQLQNLDGYDVIETIADQPWVRGHKVGMIGVSYGGISQLFTAQLQPPHLAAITPLSVIDATPTTLYPGGILNTGFALNWAKDRRHDAQPAGPTSGQPYAWAQIQGGDTTCAANQVLHGEAVDILAKVTANSHYDPAVADPLDPVTFVHKITVPTFLGCQWEDEQTGGHCPELVSHFTGTDTKWFTFTNGVHIDALDPATFNRWYDFLELYVAHQAPIVDRGVVDTAAPVVYRAAMGLPTSDLVTLPVDPIQALPTYDSALAAFERLPHVRVLFDNGAGTSPAGATVPGDPYAAFEQSFSALPIPGTQAVKWYFGPDGTLSDVPPAGGGIDRFTADARALPLTDYTGSTGGGGLWGNASQWRWDWLQNPPGTAVSYVSAPLARDTTVVGAGAVYAWVRSSTADVDLQATISEVRPDGIETFVQNGYIRASERRLSTNTDNMFHQRSTLLDPIPTFRAKDARPMPTRKFVRIAIPLYYEGHVYRAGSQIRVTIAAPNGQQPVWSFGETVPSGTSTVSISFSRNRPSFVVLQVIPGVDVPTPLPPCPSLRNQPCRQYEAIVNEVGTP